LTTMRREKVTKNARAELKHPELFGISIGAISIYGYEIHLGETQYLSGAAPLANVFRSTTPTTSIDDGCISSDGLVLGTYLHGLFDEDDFRHEFLRAARVTCGLTPINSFYDWKRQRESQWDRLSQGVLRAFDMDLICRWLELSPFASVDMETRE
jgi:adenosylcobyric acid synthase